MLYAEHGGDTGTWGIQALIVWTVLVAGTTVLVPASDCMYCIIVVMEVLGYLYLGGVVLIVCTVCVLYCI